MEIPPMELSAEQKPLEHLIDYVNAFSALDWSYEGQVVVERGGLSISLCGSLCWSGSNGTGSLSSGDRKSEALLQQVPYGALMQEDDFLTIRPEMGNWQIGHAYVSGNSRTANFRTRTMRYDFRVEFGKLRVGDPQKQSNSHALLIADVDFGIYPTAFPTDRERQGLARDGMVTSLFGRPAIIRELPKPRPREPFLIIAYDSPLLNHEERKSVLYTLSFLTGRMGAVAGEFAISGDAENCRFLEAYTPNESPVRPAVQWFAANVQRFWGTIPSQVSTALDAMHHLRVAENIPVDVAVTHLLARPRLFDEEVRDIALALDSLVEADAFAQNEATEVDPDAYNNAQADLNKAVQQVVAGHGLPKSLSDRIKERLRGANDISHGARRRAFFDRVGFEPGPREKAALKLRHRMSHRGYLWLDGDGQEKLDGFSAQTRIARTFVNAVMLSLLGYRGLVFDHLIGANMPRIAKHLSR
jgi:hypothetical protein